MTGFSLSSDEQTALLKLARGSIEYGLDCGAPLALKRDDISRMGGNLSSPGACFVTLKINGQLRGCIGSLEPRLPLAEDVCKNAFAAAFRDSRFPPLSGHELPQIHVEISVLTPVEEMSFSDEEDLLEQVRPFIDGLVLEERRHRSTFLPVVWEQLPDKKEFLEQLKLKAGLPPGYWSPTMHCSRYQSIIFEE